jgi:predicted anti-sigma-YlaC factor YlaD
MDHRPFEGWLLDNQTLTADEKRQLNAHLQGCSSCSALAEVNLALKSAKMAEPAAGFTDRFQARLAARKQALRRRNFWGFLLLALSVLSILTFFAWPVIVGLLQSPVDLLSTWIGSLLSLWVSLIAMANAGLVLFRIVPGFIPAYIWTVILFAACGWSLLWVFSLFKFAKFPQGV